MSLPVPPADHRARLLQGLAEGIREEGYRATTVADIVRRARTSRRTFYEHFDDRDACFRALDASAAQVVGYMMRQAIDESAPWDVRIAQAVDAYFALVVAEPEVTVALHRESAVLAEQDEDGSHDGVLVMSKIIVDLFEQTVSADEPIVPLTLPAAIVVTAGIREIMVRTIEAGGDVLAIKPLAIAMLSAFVQNGVGAELADFAAAARA